MERINLNDDWLWSPKFHDELCSEKIKSVSLKKLLETVRLPHSVATTPLNYFSADSYQMTSGYRRVFKTEKSWKNKRIFVTFLAAAHEATVFFNGKCLGKHSSGYTSFRFELTELLNPAGKENVLAVKVNSSENIDVPPFGFVIDYMTYGGLYRGAYLEVANENYIQDIFVHTKKSDLTAEVTLDKESDATLSVCLRKADGKKNLFEKSYQVTNAKKTSVKFDAGNVLYWSPDTPELYELTVRLLYGKILVDQKTVRLGFRDIEMRPEGLFLNGKKVLLRGMDRHQSFAHAGYALPASMQRLDADILKDELGLNAVRTSHYPQSHDFIDRCDERGLLVFTEIPGWQHIGSSKEWRDQCVKNVEEMVLQYRNHPSIFLWGVRINESPDDDKLYTRTNAAAHFLDPTRPTGGVRCIKKSHLLEDVYTFNDFVHSGKNMGCTPKKKVMVCENHPYLISEYNGHMFPTKIFDDEIHRTEHALRHANVINAVAGSKGVSGSFGWCAFDYNTHKDFGSGDGICYHGVMDMYRNPKTAAAVYESQQEAHPVLELSSTMDIGEHPASVRGENWIFTNADSVRMYLNGKFISEFKKEDSPYKNIPHGPIMIDDFVGNRLVEDAGLSVYAAGNVKKLLNFIALYGEGAIGLKQILTFIKLFPLGFNRQKITSLYTDYVGNWGARSSVFRFEAVKDGKIVKTIFKGPVESLEIKARVSSNILHEGDTWDAAEVRLTMCDQFGNTLPYFDEPVTFETTGPVQIIGGESSCFRGGATGLYIKTKGRKGKASLLITCGHYSKKIDFVIQ